MLSSALEGNSIKWGSLGFVLAVPLQHFNLLNICDKAQLGHLLRDSTGNKTPCWSRRPRSDTHSIQTQSAPHYLLLSATPLLGLSVCVWTPAGTCIQHPNRPSKRCEIKVFGWDPCLVKRSGTMIANTATGTTATNPYLGCFVTLS